MLAETYTDRIIEKLEKVNRIYAERMYRTVGRLTDLTCLRTPEHFRRPPECSEPLREGEKWGGEYQNLWIRTRFTVPKELEGKKLYLRPDTQAVEILLFVNGKPDGIFNTRGDYMGLFHSVQLLTECAVPGETFDIAMECYAGHYCAGCSSFDHYGIEGVADPDEYIRTFGGIELCECEEDVFGFVFDLNAVLQMASELQEDNFLRHRARAVLTELYQNVIVLPVEYPDEAVHASVAKCREIMRPLLQKSASDTTRGCVALLGHSHMDTAWLWPVSETIRKCARTYSNAVKLMREYPEYKFIQSSALHLEWMRVYYPEIFEEIRHFVREGRYEPNGGVWVECDCNITSGELMARQFMYGQHFTRQYLDYTSDSFWLPDTFGYNGAIPQIMTESDVQYFFTTKLSWNDMNQFPYATFRWEGIDGTEIITHLHNLELVPDIKTIEQQVGFITNKQVFEEKLFAYGHGDGGGGPTPALLERARRLTEIPGLPRVEYSTASEFMARAERVREKLPEFAGELYFEGHRGTLTTMHDIKRTNRKAEFALRDMDYFNAVTGHGKGDRTDPLYKVLLTNQFHDILPGTCVTGVADLAIKQNKEVIAEARQIAYDRAGELTDSDESAVTLFNTLSFDRHDPVVLADCGKSVAEHPCQTYTDVTGRTVQAVGGVTIPALGAVTLRYGDTAPTYDCPFTWKDGVLETPCLHAEFNEFGEIVSLIDKTHGREVRREGGLPLNTLVCGQDAPLGWDNWDLEAETLLCREPQRDMLGMEVVSCGPVLFVLRCSRRIGQRSRLDQDIIFRADSAQVDFHTVIDWHEKHTYLKTVFDVDVLSRTVRNEIQFGHMERPTTRNTQEEKAKFEVCNHKWSDLSESRFGVAILNDCKYGISALNSELALTLHRGGTRPDESGDAGVHECTYSVLPHGAFDTQSVICPAYELNVPAVAHAGSAGEKTLADGAFVPSCCHVMLEALKPAALRSDAVVARYYETEGCKDTCTVAVPNGYTKVFDVNILEDIRTELPVENGVVRLPFHPFQIRSVMFIR